MARLFTAASTAKLSYGTPAGLENLAQSGSLTIIATLRRNADADNLYIFTKSTAITTRGWQFLLAGDGGGNFGFPRIIVGGSTFGDRIGSAGTNCVLNQHEIVAATLSGSTSALFRSAIQTPIISISSTVNSTVVTPGSDSGDAAYGWNSNSGVLSLGGDGGWIIIYDVVLTLTQMRRIQQGILTFFAGIEAANEDIQDRGIAIMKSVSGHRTLTYVASDGTITDYADTPLSPSLSGTTTIGVDSSNWFAPIEFDNDKVPSADKEQTTYRYTSDFARKRFTTSATGFTAWYETTLDPSTWPNQAVLGYDIDGVWTGKLSSGALGINTGSVSGLSASSKEVALINGARSNPTLASAIPWEGTFLTLVQFTAAATELAPPTLVNELIALGDSALVSGYVADSPQRYAAFQVLRRNLPTWCDGVSQYAAGGMSWYDICNDAPTRAANITILTAGDPRSLVFSLGANDKGRNAWATATATSSILAFLNGLLAGFTGEIYLCSLTVTTVESVENTFGEVYQDWRDLMAALPAQTNVPSRVNFIDMFDAITTDQLGDAVHPSTSGHQTLSTVIASEFATVDDRPSIPTDIGWINIHSYL